MSPRRLSSVSLFALGLACAALPASAQVEGEVGKYSDATVQGSVLEPRPVEIADDAELAGRLAAPDGFKVEVFARDLENPRMLAVAEDGTLYATRRKNGDVIMIRDADKDGKADEVKTVASRAGMHGIALDGDQVFLVTVNDVYVTDRRADGSFGELRRIINDLPDSGQHPNRTIAIGPDDHLYISVGSTCNACDESSPESATILRAKKDGTSRTIFARGLRNTIGFGWEPTSGTLYGADHGIDWLGDEEQQEELNAIEKDKQYGWPYIYAFSSFNPQDNPPDGMTLEQWAELSEEPVLGYTAHSAPMQMGFVRGGDWPADYQGDAFIAMRGSWNRRPPSGYEVARVDFESGKPVKIEPFLTGFLTETENDGYGFLGRPTGLAFAPDGAMFVSDDTNGVIYRVTAAAGGETTAAIPQAAPQSPDAGAQAPSEIALSLVTPKSGEGLNVEAGFRPDEMLPVKFVADGDNASPKLSWAAPEGAKSFVVIVDDPDAESPKPFTHWIVYDIPARVTSLREGFPTEPVVVDPKGVKQGLNSMGATGYFGPKPPAGDPAHHYHFQVFALDREELGLDPGAKREAVIAAMKDHVIAAGEIVGRFERK